MKKRPTFVEIKSYEEFIKYYWYLSELKDICKIKGIDTSGGKIDLNHRIEEYYKGFIIKPMKKTTVKKQDVELTVKTRLLESGFAMRTQYREFFGEVLGVKNFHFTADMAAVLKKVRTEKDVEFTVQDLIDVYTGKSDYARYDTSSCQWNKFVKAFCEDPQNAALPNKLKTAAKVWKRVRESDQEKIYTPELMKQYRGI